MRWALTVLLLSVAGASQAPPQGPPAQPPPPPPPAIVERIQGPGRGNEVLTITSSGLSRIGRMSDVRVANPSGNALTAEKVELGRRLFFDAVLSKDRSVSCATCHKPEMAFADERAIAVGIFGRVGKRHSPSLVNRGLGRTQFWDGRAATLEDLALQPLRDANEMDLPPDEAIARLKADPSYVTAFQTVFGQPPSTEDLGRALASFVRVIRSENSPYDRFVAGDTAALSAEQRKGLEVFRTRGRCSICHSEPMFTNEIMQNTGVAWKPDPEGSGGAYLDEGQFAVTKNARHRGSFKTPTLREIARTAPYMHDGSLATLADVVDFYNNGGRPNPNLVGFLRPLGLTPDEKQALVKFMEALSGDVTSTMLPRDRTMPDLSGTWTRVKQTPAKARSAGTPWSAEVLTLTQSQTLLSVSAPPDGASPGPGPLRFGTRLIFDVSGPPRQIVFRDGERQDQRVTASAAWRDMELVLTSTTPMAAADGTTSTQEDIAVLTLDASSKLTIQVTRKGPQTESWTATYQKR